MGFAQLVYLGLYYHKFDNQAIQMRRTVNTLYYTFLILIFFLIVIHIKRIDYYENPSKEIIENIYTGLTNISTHFSQEDSLDYRLNLSFNHIQAKILVKDIEVFVVGINDDNSTVLRINKILPYSGMHNWDIPEFKKFSKIPTNLKSLNSESNSYFAYDFILTPKSDIELEKFKIIIKLNFTENSIDKNINKELIILKKNKIRFKPLDNHSDGTLILIPILIIVTIILAVCKSQRRRRENQVKRE
ncbi:hypothetical protein VB776_14860 [Arcicella sp. DC2W]|uniref:Uncharacterized protein n=1 Tax=Arcicella gelida TaxID=2984195 RepID=A0ABU5S6U8_9BACT|nr:hypothetical protein [Arcicella sp. DC2W]MEA5404209.1 hypothetical protein [Arcicella sp. DC2W]